MIKLKYKKFFKEDIPRAQAYWISPIGRILPLENDSKHIEKIMENPSAYGLNREEIVKMYQDENEELGSEGKAREKIIVSLVREGWIRIRHYERADTWTVNINRLTNRTKDYLQHWASQMVKNGFPYSEVVIDMPGRQIRYSMTNLSQDVMFNESKRIHKFFLTVVRNNY